MGRRHHKIISKSSLLIGLIIIGLCNCVINEPIEGIYFVEGHPMGQIILLKDSTYKADYRSIGYSEGRWYSTTNKVYLTSFYQMCCIDSVFYVESKSDTSNFTILDFRLFDNTRPSITYLVLFSDNSADTILIFNSNYRVSKLDENNSFQIICPIDKGNIAKSAVIGLSKRDQVTIYYDFVYDSKYFLFYKNESFKIFRRKRVLRQIGNKK